ncbi:hypothetical protein [Halioxenophilus aromaticivorans]|uniref:Uncharacterized protein n=1 Tax=Halioxenophilus aromaticivorans TaxID=1306992 RepID=A0AAV3U049_9ALTE
MECRTVLASVVLAIIVIAALLGCSEGPATSSDSTDLSSGSAVQTNGDSDGDGASGAKRWQGEAQGFTTNATPTSDTTAYLIALGSVDAHWSAFKELLQNRDYYQVTSAEIMAVLNEDFFAFYDAVEDRALEQSKTRESLRPTLESFLSAEVAQAIDAGPFAEIPDWKTTSERIKYWLKGTTESVKRTTREILLSRSGLLRRAGDAFAIGLDKNGHVIDTVAENLAQGFLHAAMQVSRYHISFCDAHKNALKNSSEAGFALRGKLADKNANAGDVYQLAGQILETAESLPDC